MGASHRARHRSRWFQVTAHQNLTPFTSVLNRDIGSEPFGLLQLRKIEAHAREGWRKSQTIEEITCRGSLLLQSRAGAPLAHGESQDLDVGRPTRPGGCSRTRPVLAV
jgi:hypothetical protein